MFLLAACQDGGPLPQADIEGAPSAVQPSVERPVATVTHRGHAFDIAFDETSSLPFEVGLRVRNAGQKTPSEHRLQWRWNSTESAWIAREQLGDVTWRVSVRPEYDQVVISAEVEGGSTTVHEEQLVVRMPSMRAEYLGRDYRWTAVAAGHRVGRWTPKRFRFPHDQRVIWGAARSQGMRFD